MEIVVASVPDRETVVAEMWVNGEQCAEIRQEEGTLIVELYPRPNGAPWLISHAELLTALEEASRRLEDGSNLTST